MISATLRVPLQTSSFASQFRRLAPDNLSAMHHLKGIVGEKNVLTGEQTSPYDKPYRYHGGRSLAVVQPITTQQVSNILKYCHAHGIGVVPQGGNTGLVGASVTHTNRTQIILSTTLLNKDVFEFNADACTLAVGAGHILGDVNRKLAQYRVSLPIDVGSIDTCNIGGILATNAAGTRAGRYGSAGKRALEITVVVADGTIQTIPISFSTIAPALPQDNSRIHSQNPFIGSQGWLGVITQAVLTLEPRPVQSETVMLIPGNIGDIATIRKKFTTEYGREFTAFEWISAESLRLVAKHTHMPYLLKDVPESGEYALLIEVSSHDKEKDLNKKILGTQEALYKDGLIINGINGHPEIYWKHRHAIADSLTKAGTIIATDIALRNNDLEPFIQTVTPELRSKYPHLVIAPFGHGMLGAMHYNAIWPTEHPIKITPQDKYSIQKYIYDRVFQYEGTFSAEHGIGPHNQWAYDAYIPAKVKQDADMLKKMYDPRGILNPNIYYGSNRDIKMEPCLSR